MQTTTEQLYFLIRKRIKRMKFPRLLIDPDEVANEVFLRLMEQHLPKFGSEDFENLLRRTTGHVVRNFKLFSKPALDVDELEEDKHPFYEMNFYMEEESFEYVFAKFCETFPEPKRTVFKYSRLLAKQDIAALVGISRNEVARIIKSMPELFRRFIEKNRCLN